LANPNSCKICDHSQRSDIEKLLVEGVPYRTIISKYPDLNLDNLYRHKKNHFSAEQRQEFTAPEISKEEILAAGQPDIVKIIENQVTEYELIKAKRALTPQETLDRARYLEFLIKIRLASLEAKPKTENDVDQWLATEMEKLKRGDYDVRNK
jgi:hypothetical protein